ncbi:MAG: hypothetical protein ACYCO5_07520 [Acidobacteriaceae bacterium]
MKLLPTGTCGQLSGWALNTKGIAGFHPLLDTPSSYDQTYSLAERNDPQDVNGLPFIVANTGSQQASCDGLSVPPGLIVIHPGHNVEDFIGVIRYTVPRNGTYRIKGSFVQLNPSYPRSPASGILFINGRQAWADQGRVLNKSLPQGTFDFFADDLRAGDTINFTYTGFASIGLKAALIEAMAPEMRTTGYIVDSDCTHRQFFQIHLNRHFAKSCSEPGKPISFVDDWSGRVIKIANATSPLVANLRGYHVRISAYVLRSSSANLLHGECPDINGFYFDGEGRGESFSSCVTEIKIRSILSVIPFVYPPEFTHTVHAFFALPCNKFPIGRIGALEGLLPADRDFEFTLPSGYIITKDVRYQDKSLTRVGKGSTVEECIVTTPGEPTQYHVRMHMVNSDCSNLPILGPRGHVSSIDDTFTLTLVRPLQSFINVNNIPHVTFPACPTPSSTVNGQQFPPSGKWWAVIKVITNNGGFPQKDSINVWVRGGRRLRIVDAGAEPWKVVQDIGLLCKGLGFDCPVYGDSVALPRGTSISVFASVNCYLRNEKTGEWTVPCRSTGPTVLGQALP